MVVLPESWHAGAPGGAVFSGCRRYRYLLWRRWASGPAVLFVALNPNNADAEREDPTIRRMRGFARDWGYGACLVANIFSVRAATPDLLRARRGPVGRATDDWLVTARAEADMAVACWGNHGSLNGRDLQVRALFDRWHVFRLNRTGQPVHPLYLPADCLPVVW